MRYFGLIFGLMGALLRLFMALESCSMLRGKAARLGPDAGSDAPKVDHRVF